MYTSEQHIIRLITYDNDITDVRRHCDVITQAPHYHNDTIKISYMKTGYGTLLDACIEYLQL